MPQTITSMRIHRTITLALNDLCTVPYTGDSDGQLYIVNNGPGVAWLSFDSTVPAAVANVNCFALRVGGWITITNLERGTTWTANADTASTIIAVNQMP